MISISIQTFYDLYFPTFIYIPSWIIIIDSFRIVSYSSCIIGDILCNNAASTNRYIVPNYNIFNNAYIRTNISVVSYYRSLAVVTADSNKLR